MLGSCHHCNLRGGAVMANQTLTVVSDTPMSGIEANGFYQTPNSMTIKAIRAKLTASDWALWAYLQMIDPFGDRMIELPTVSEIAANIEVSERQVKRSLKKLEDLELYYWEPVVIRGQNLAGKQAKQLCQKKKASKSNSQENKSSRQRKMTELSNTGQNCPKPDEIVQKMTDLSKTGQNCPNQAPEPLSDKDSSSPQILQTYSDFIQTLSEGEKENFLEFGKKKANQLPHPPQLPLRWIEANFEDLRSQWEKSQGKPSSALQSKWENHPQREEWIEKIRKIGPVAFQAEDLPNEKLRQEFYFWADDNKLIWEPIKKS